MGVYTFMFLDGPAVSAMLEFDDCANDAMARERALTLLAAAPHRDGVEFWKTNGRPMRVTRADLPAQD